MRLNKKVSLLIFVVMAFVSVLYLGLANTATVTSPIQSPSQFLNISNYDGRSGGPSGLITPDPEVSGFGQNKSGAQNHTHNLNFSVRFTANADGVNGHNGTITNVSFMFQLMSNLSYVLNVTVHNFTYNRTAASEGGNVTYFNFTFNASGLPTSQVINYTINGSRDLPNGMYNVTFMSINATDAGTVHNMTGMILVIDTHAPMITSFSIADGKSFSDVNTTGTSVLNYSINLTVGDNLSGVMGVVLSFVNITSPTNGPTNFTAYNASVNGTNVPMMSNGTMQNSQSGGNASCSSTDRCSGLLGNLSNGTMLLKPKVNLSQLAEGTYTLSVYAYDYANNQRISNISVQIDRTAPVITLTKSSSTDSSLTITITTDGDASSCTSDRGTVSGSGASQTITASSLSADTTYQFVVTCTDEAGNTGNKAESFTTDATSSGGSSGGSGSGGGSSSGVSGQSQTKVWTSINAGETATIEVKDGLGVTDVSFVADKTVYGTVLKVEKVALDALPEEFGRKVYAVVRITETNVDKILRGSATINFKVDNNWLVENKLTKESIGLFRYAESKWDELATTVGMDDGTATHFTAQTPGLSYFVIGERAVPAAAPEAAPAQPVEQPVTEPVAEEGSSAIGWVIAIVVVLALGLWWFLAKRKK